MIMKLIMYEFAEILSKNLLASLIKIALKCPGGIGFVISVPCTIARGFFCT